MLYAYFDFNAYFFKILVIYIFWANLVPKSEVLQINWNLVQTYIAIWLLQLLTLFFQNICHSYNFRQIWSQNLSFSLLESSICVHYKYCMLIIIKSYNFPKIFIPVCFAQVSFQFVFSIMKELHCISMLNSSEYGEQQILRWNFPQKFMNGKYLEKLHTKTVINQHITVCPCIKFQSIWRTLDFAQICPKNTRDQNFEKINVKIVISIKQCTTVPSFS